MSTIDNRRELAKELRKRTQTFRQLRHPIKENYCAVGVAVNLIDPNAWKVVNNIWYWTGDGNRIYRRYRVSWDALVSLNDVAGYSFEELAHALDTDFELNNVNCAKCSDRMVILTSNPKTHCRSCDIAVRAHG